MSDYIIIKLVISDSLHYASGPSLLLTSERVPVIAQEFAALFSFPSSHSCFILLNGDMGMTKLLAPLSLFQHLTLWGLWSTTSRYHTKIWEAPWKYSLFRSDAQQKRSTPLSGRAAKPRDVKLPEPEHAGRAAQLLPCALPDNRQGYFSVWKTHASPWYTMFYWGADSFQAPPMFHHPHIIFSHKLLHIFPWQSPRLRQRLFPKTPASKSFFSRLISSAVKQWLCCNRWCSWWSFFSLR